MMTRNKSEAGFTLLEVMVAVAILGLSLLFVLQLFSRGLVSAKVSDEYTMVVIEARERMNETLMVKDLTEGVKSGVSPEGYSWTVAITPMDLNITGSGVGVMKIVATVRSPNKRGEVVLETVRTTVVKLGNG